MNLNFLKFLTLLFFSSISNAQVGINTEQPDQSAILDVNDTSKGILIPRVSDLTTITNPANGLLVYDITKNCLSQNTGNATNPKWVCMNAKETNFFYMPSIIVETGNLGELQTKELFELYKEQFSNPQVRSFINGTSGDVAPVIQHVQNAEDLYYYVTDYDRNVFTDISISSGGVMSYRVAAAASNFSYMNIVFVVK